MRMLDNINYIPFGSNPWTEIPPAEPDAEPDPRRSDSTARVARGLSPCDDEEEEEDTIKEMLMDEMFRAIRKHILFGLINEKFEPVANVIN